MSKIVKFPQEKRMPEQVVRLKDFADHVDHLVIQALAERGIPPHDIAGALAHRLGALLANVDRKEELWELCHEILRKEAFGEGQKDQKKQEEQGDQSDE